MLIARIKCKDRKEKKKLIYGYGKETFMWRGDPYKIDPSCIYFGDVLSFFSVRFLDYSQGNPNPFCYYNLDDADTPKRSVLSPRPVAEIIRLIMASLTNTWLYLLIAIGFAVVVSLAAAYFSFQSAEQLRFLSERLMVFMNNSVSGV